MKLFFFLVLIVIVIPLIITAIKLVTREFDREKVKKATELANKYLTARILLREYLTTLNKHEKKAVFRNFKGRLL